MEKVLNMNKYDFSVMVLCYKPDMKKLFQTLYSVLMQEGVSYEIILADDGSGMDYRHLVEQWFEKNNFSDYKIVMNKQNRGTVKNLLSGLDVAEGKYTKNISPGDYLYREDSLAKAFFCLEENHCRIAFGGAKYYALQNGALQFFEHQSPVDMKPYLHHDIRKIRRNYLLFRDYILGAALVFDKETAIQYTKKISDGVKYAEDTAVIAMLAEGQEIAYMGENIVWYEYGTGISTNASQTWAQIIFDENKYIFEQYKDTDNIARKAYQINFAKMPANRYLALMKKVAQYPPFLCFSLEAWKQQKRKRTTREEDCVRLNRILKMEDVKE